ncbi:hypothetical protein ACE04B_00835 [Rhizobium phaseoli]
MEFKLFDEKPSQQDLFDGQNHSNLAEKISSILAMKDINTIGLDGCLGSGKSTVLSIIKDKLKGNEKITFIDFDVELYHHGSTKKALINVLHDGMKPKVKKYIESAFCDYKNVALGNKFSYEKQQKSSMSAWTFSFIFTSLLSIQSFRFFLLDLSKSFNNEPYNAFTLIAESALLISPIITLLFFWMFKSKSNSINLSDIIKKNSLDTITETVLISKEVGALELKNALSGFLKCVDDHTFILIIDNLDRVSKQKVKEIWSDIELITHNSNSKLKIIIPYSAEHLAKSLSDNDEEGKEGMEFLSKRLPVSFRVPPIISTGWRSAFDYFWRETFKDSHVDQSKEISQLIEIWLPKNYLQVTPRLLKRLINDINISLYTTPKTVSPIAASFYILSCRYNNNPFVWSTLNYEIDNTDDFLSLHNIPTDYFKKYSSSYSQLQRLYDNNKSGWVEDILCLHFQTNAYLAKSELITEPLLVSINQGNPQDFFRLSGIFGFDSLWKSTLDKTDPTKWITILSEADDNHLGITNTIINDVIKALNTRELTIENKTLDINLIHSLEKLKSKKISYEGSYLSTLSNYLAESIEKFNLKHLSDELSDNERSICESLIKIANSFCALEDENKISNIFIAQDNLSGNFFATMLYDHIDEYKSLNINAVDLRDEEFIKAMNSLTMTNSGVDLFNDFFTSRIKVDDEALTRAIKTKVFKAAENIISTIEKQESTLQLNEVNLLVLFSGWHDKNQSKLASYLDEIKEDHPINYLCLFLLNAIESKSYDISDIISNNDIDDKIFNTPEFHQTFAKYLIFSTSFEKVILSLDDTDITDYVIPSIKSLLENHKVQRVYIAGFLKKHYSILRAHFEKDLVLDFFANWDEPSARIIRDTMKSEIESIDSTFLNELLDSNQLPLTKKSLINVTRDKISETKDISTLFVSLDNNMKSIIKHCAENSVSLLKTNGDAFSKWLTNNSYSDIPTINNFRLIFDILSAKDKKITLDALTDLIYQRDFDIKKQTLLIEQFGDIITLEDSDKNLINRTVIRLFPYAVDSISLSTWLDNQNFNFTRWKTDDKETVQNIILTNPEKFPKISDKLLKSRKKRKIE